MEYCDLILGVCQDAKSWLDLWFSFLAVVVSSVSLAVAVRYSSKSFRPIISVAVRTHLAGNEAITYNLEVMNSGAIPARDIQIKALLADVESAIRNPGRPEIKSKWISCFDPECRIPMLQNGEKACCSFGMSKADDSGFWRYGATIPVVVEYKSWFWKSYVDSQTLYIRDSESFTGYMWSST